MNRTGENHELHGENNFNCTGKITRTARGFKLNGRRHRALFTYAGGADRTESTVQRTLGELPEALETAMLCYFELFIGSKLKEY